MTSDFDRKDKHRYSPPESLDDLKNILYVFPILPDKVKELAQRIKQVNEEADALRDVTSSVYNVKYGEDDGYASLPRSSGTSDPTFQKAVIVMERYDKRIVRYMDDIDLITYLQQIVGDALEDLTDDEYKIIHARYFVELTWRKIAEKVHLCRNSCVQIHDKALGFMLSKMKGCQELRGIKKAKMNQKVPK